MSPLVSFLLALFGDLPSEELNGWLPRLAAYLVKLNAQRLPAQIAARMEEDWMGHLSAIPGSLSKLYFAVDLFRAVASLRHECRPRVPAASRVRGARSLDVAVSATLLVIYMPVFIAIALFVRSD